MSWPHDNDYVEALQNAGHAFEDPELRAGSVELTTLGMPRPRAGNFAIVFKVSSAGRDWAIKCFKKSDFERHERYRAIADHLARVNVPALSRFQYLERGVRVGGTWYPILKMEWLKGELLSQWIEANLNKPDRLRALAKEWIGLVDALRTASIGHGDLQHGNVVVCNDVLRLIDYDGMYVPALNGRLAAELGHPNYQHPRRTELHYGPAVDRFSSWVIFVAIAALGIDPGLWHRHAKNQETILFRRDDFLRPDQSPLFAEIARSADVRLRDLGHSLRTFIGQDPQQLPLLSDDPASLIPAQPKPSTLPSVITAPPNDSREGVNAWWQDHLPTPAPPTPSKALIAIDSSLFNAPSVSNLTWVVGSLSQPTNPPRQFANNLRLERFTYWGGVLVSFSILLAGMIGSLSVGAAMVLLIGCVSVVATTLILRYRTALPVEERIQVEAGARDLYRSLKQAQSKRDRLAQDYHRLEVAHGKACAKLKAKDLRIDRQIAAAFEKMSHQQRLDKERLTRDRASLMDEWRASLIKLAHHADGQMADIRTGLLTVEKEEQAALDALVQQERAEAVALHDRHGRQIHELEAQIRASTSNESRELTAANDVLRRQYVLNELMHRSIRVAEIPGLGPGLKQRLLNAGIWTAADVEEARVSSVEGIGPSRTAAILEWQAAIERAAQQRAPTLSPADRKRIADFHSAQRKGWESQVDQLRVALTSATTALRSKYQSARAAAQSMAASRRHALQNEIVKLEAAKNAQEQHLNADCSTRQATLDTQIRGLEQAIAEARARAKSPWQEAIGVQRKTWSQLESEVQKRAKVIEQALNSLRTTETELLWRLSKHEAEMESFRDVTARAYLRAVTRLK
jgi:hypothetical protein